MKEFVIDYYLMLKALHIIFVISWMVGLLYLPRLFVYHAKAQTKSELYETLAIMEFKLIRYIMTPAMLISFILGGMLIYAQDTFLPWLHMKFLLVLLLAALHGLMVSYYKKFRNYNNQKSQMFFRVFNEIPTIIMIAIVFLVVIKP